MFDEAEPSSDCSRNLDYRVQGLAPGGAGLWWFVAGLCIDFLGAVLYNSGRFRLEPGFERMFDYG